MAPDRHIVRARWALLLLGVLAMLATSARAQIDAPRLRAALDAACSGAALPDAVLAVLGGEIEVPAEDLDAPRGMLARRHRLLLPVGDRVRVDTHRQDTQLIRVILEVEQRIAGALRPRWWVVADGDCRVRVARRIDYRETGVAKAVQLLRPSMQDGDSRLALDASVPPGAVPRGVPVAMVDSGVNYTLPHIAARLARDAHGQALGYDYWDQDARPYDFQPSSSAFLPQRHGTRTASLLLDDAPVATLVPMRHPRVDLARMASLVADAVAHDIRIVTLSPGGDEREAWRTFEDAARAQPQILFIVSAGNGGRDLDLHPRWPASLRLDNLITVTSSDAQGLPARGANWGRHSVHLLVPAENLVTTHYSGYAMQVSGSHYAAARVAALAACLQAAHPQWQAPQLKQAIFERAERAVHPALDYVAVGVLGDPTLTARGACEAEPALAARVGRLVLDEAALYPDESLPVARDVPALRDPDAPSHTDRDAPSHSDPHAPSHSDPHAPSHSDPHAPSHDVHHVLVPLTLVWIENAGWRLDALPGIVARAAAILRQCELRMSRVEVELVRVPRGLRYFDTTNALELMRSLPATPPAVWFMRDTLQQPAFDAQAIGHANVGAREALLNTIWLTSQLEHPGVALAHELFHLIANTAGHVPEPDNLMHSLSSASTTRLVPGQCERLLQVGSAVGLVETR